MKKTSSVSEVFKSKRKYPGFRKNFHDYWTEYTQYTGIHGFMYMGEQGRSYFEKFSWLVLFCISLYFCISLIIQTWVKWDTSPVLVSFARSPTPVWQIPFPAITICPETKTRQRAYNFTDAYNGYFRRKNLTDEEIEKFAQAALVCDSHLFHAGSKFVNYSVIDTLMEVAPQFPEVFYQCKWTLLNETCANFFSPILTEDGLCFTFNMLDRSELLKNNVFFHGDYMQNEGRLEGWTLEMGYPKDAPRDTFPRRAMSAGSSAGFFLLLRSYKQDLDYICRGPVQGFRILLHHPSEVPRVTSQYFRAPLNQEVVVSVKPDMMTTSEGLKGYDPHRRQCYFPDERHLAFYQNYTQQNCQVECLTNYTLKQCDCVAYHMPHEENTKICGAGSITCMFEAQTELLQQQVESGLKETTDGGGCDCLPGCTSLTYNAETSQAQFNWRELFEAFEADPEEDPGLQLTRVTIFFKEQQFITSERNELYGPTDFLANCGGILGLFTGFSFLSFIEIVYFLSLRVMCNVKIFGRHYWSGSKDLINNDAYVHDKIDHEA